MGKATRKLKLVTEAESKPLLKLDFGCGPHPREGFEGVDVRPFDGKVKHVFDLTKTPWSWADNSAAEAHASHFVEHLTAPQRIEFMNELYRILVPGGACTLIVPHWSSCRAYGDLTHQWPPVSEFWFYYLNPVWRAANAPHNDTYTCNFEVTWGYNMRPDLSVRNQEYQQFAMQNYKEACLDIVATLKAVKP